MLQRMWELKLSRKIVNYRDQSNLRFNTVS